MSSPNIKDLLTSFNPSSNFLAITSGDGRIKIWDTLKGQLQYEFADIAPSDALDMRSKSEIGHLSLDYTCMKWVQLEKKKKRPGSSLLVLGTGNGDVVALNVAEGRLQWKLCDCHPGGVSAISFSRNGLCIYTAGIDGMVCQIDYSTGSLMSKFRSSTKAISSLSISPDGKILATAAAQLKVFTCSDSKKIQKFSGHTVAVRCMIFSEDGKYILSSGVGERYIAVWKLDGGKKQSASCVLSMEHPAVLLDSKGSDTEGTEGAGLYVLAISEMGLCYFWYGRSIEELRNSKPTKISLCIESSLSKNHKGSAIFAAKLQAIDKPASGLVLLAYGSLIKPSFEKLQVQYGVDMNLDISQDGILLPVGQSFNSQKGQSIQTKVTALDRANAEDAMLPLPKLYDHGKKRKHRMPHSITDVENVVLDPVVNSKSKTREVNPQRVDENDITSMEDRLRSVGILGNKYDIKEESYLKCPTTTVLDTAIFNGAHLLDDVNMPPKKIRAHILSMSPSDAYKFLEILVSVLKTRSASSKNVLPWIYHILVNHGHFIVSQESSAQMLDALQKVTRLKCAVIQPLLQLSGRLRLIMTQIDKAGQNMVQAPLSESQVDASEDEDEDEIDEVVYGEEEDLSQSDSDDDNE